MNTEELLAKLAEYEKQEKARLAAMIPLRAKIIIGVIAAALIGVAVFSGIRHFQGVEAILLNEQQVKSVAELQQKLKLSEETARQLQEKIIVAQSKPPVVSYAVQAPTIQQAAAKEQIFIKEGKSQANQVPADKTVVTPNETEQKVDVYRIALDKPRGIGVYVSTQSAGAMLQYKNLVLFGGPQFQGGYELGAAYLIRF